MNWQLAPAYVGAAITLLFGVGAAIRPSALELVGVTATSPLGKSEIRAVFGGGMAALGAACLLLRDPLVFGVVGAAWLGDVAVRSVAVFVDKVPPKQAALVMFSGAAIGLALLSGYLLA